METWSVVPFLMVAGVGILAVAGLAWCLFATVRWILRQRDGRALLGILAAGGVLLAMRAFDAPFGSGDEIVNFTSGLVASVSAFHLVEYPHPALYFNLAASLDALAIAARWAFGEGGLPAAAAAVLLDHALDLLVAARLLSVLAWLGTAVVAWRMALRVCPDRHAALLAPVLLIPAELLYPASFSPYPLGVLLSYLLAYEALFREDRPELDPHRAAVLGVLGGLAFGAHYLSGLFFLAVPVAILAGPRRRPWASLGAFSVTAAVAFVAVNPRLFLDLGEYARTFFYRVGELGQPDPRRLPTGDGTDPTGDPAFYLGVLSRQFIAWVALAGAAAALARSRQRNLATAFALGLPLLLLAVLSAASTRYLHYLLFVYPALAVLGAPLLSAGVEAAARWRRGRLALLVLALALCAGATWWNADRGDVGRGSLRSSDPVRAFRTFLATTPGPGQVVGVTSPSLAEVEQAIRRDIAPAWLGPALRDRVTGTRGVEVRWMTLGDLRTGRAPDWLYALEWSGAAGGYLPRDDRLEVVRQVRIGPFLETVARRRPDVPPAFAR